MNAQLEIVLGVAMFTAVILALVVLILIARITAVNMATPKTISNCAFINVFPPLYKSIPPNDINPSSNTPTVINTIPSP
jgi:hypothetical protein